MMQTSPTTAALIRTALLAFDVDTADAISSQALASAEGALAQGWDPAGDAYTLDAMPGDAEALGALLGRELTRDERRALEVCIRHHLDGARALRA